MSKYANCTRMDPMFLRNQFVGDGPYDMPLVLRQKITWEGNQAIGFHNAKATDKRAPELAVHGFKDDYRINSAYQSPERAFKRVEHYACLFTPNYSFFSNMPIARQIDAVFRSRWVGAYWQSRGKEVVANVGWGLPDSYDFCFDGVEKGSTVIVSTMGTGRTRKGFLHGYEEMLKRIEPEEVWCYCNPLPEMSDTVARVIPYEASGMSKRAKIDPGQLSIFSFLGEEVPDEHARRIIRRAS